MTVTAGVDGGRLESEEVRTTTDCAATIDGRDRLNPRCRRAAVLIDVTQPGGPGVTFFDVGLRHKIPQPGTTAINRTQQLKIVKRQNHPKGFFASFKEYSGCVTVNAHCFLLFHGSRPAIYDGAVRKSKWFT